MRDYTAKAARLPENAKSDWRSATLVLEPEGYLAVRILFLGEAVKDLEVKFFHWTNNARGAAVKDPDGVLIPPQRTDDTGLAKIENILFPVGTYTCEIEGQELNGQKLHPLITTVESVKKPFFLVLPLGRPYYDIPEPLPE